MRSLRTLRTVTGVLIATGGAVVACYNEVPGPQGPLPSPTREAPPMGPTPGTPLPLTQPHLTPAPDGGLPVPSNEPAKLSVPIAAKIVAAADEGSGSGSAAPTPDKPPVTVDAGVDSASDLPAEVPDAGPAILRDAGTPLRR